MSRGLGLALAVTALLACAGGAFAAQATRDAYREGAEPICKANTQANERILQGVRAEVKAGKLKPAAARFAKAAAALKKSLAQLRAIPQPSADRAKLSKWFGDIGTEAGLFEAVAAKLRAANKAQAERLVVKLTSNADRANNVVIGFEFTYCRFEPSRFT